MLRRILDSSQPPFMHQTARDLTTDGLFSVLAIIFALGIQHSYHFLHQDRSTGSLADFDFKVLIGVSLFYLAAIPLVLYFTWREYRSPKPNQTARLFLQKWVEQSRSQELGSRTDFAIRTLKCMEYENTFFHTDPVVLASFPREFWQLNHLEILHLKGYFQRIPDNFANFSRLDDLRITKGCLSSLLPSILKLTHLKRLDLSHNVLTTIPSGIGQLTRLINLNLNHNHLCSLPNEILNLPQTCRIDLSGNFFSFQIINHLQRAIERSGYNGPRINFSIYEGEIEERPLEVLLKELYDAAGKKPLQLTNLCLAKAECENLRNWLARLSLIGDYQKNKRKELAVSIHNSLEKAENNETFREIFWNCVKKAHETCGDRMALSVLYLDLQYQIHESQDDLPRLAYLLGHGSWALGELEKLAANKAKSLMFVDEIEVYLAYPIKLKEELQLPIIMDTMLYFACSSVTTEDLEVAAGIVKNLLSDKKAYYNFLSNDHTWQLAIKKHKSQEYAAIEQRRENLAYADDYSAAKEAFEEGFSKLIDDILAQNPLPFL